MSGYGVRDDIQQSAKSSSNVYDVGAGGIVSAQGVMAFLPVSGLIFGAVFIVFGVLAPFVILPMLYLAYRVVFKPPTNYIEQDEPKSWVTGL
jgi:hypothetical protein